MTPRVYCAFLATELHCAVQFNVFDICDNNDNNVIEQILRLLATEGVNIWCRFS